MKKAINILALVVAIAFCGCQTSIGQARTKLLANRQKSKSAPEWKKILTDNAYYIMVEAGTEPPYRNAYHDNHQKGVYVSAATGEVLFTSDDKFESGTGWPSFVKPIDAKKIEVITDNTDGMTRDEVIEKSTGLHLGHVFDDGPANRGGKRYCMNSGALKFVKK